MDPILEARYLILLQAYQVGGREALKLIKAELLRSVRPQRRSRPRSVLRPDAALCLLTLYDQMIVRPYGQRGLESLPVPEIGKNRKQFTKLGLGPSAQKQAVTVTIPGQASSPPAGGSLSVEGVWTELRLRTVAQQEIKLPQQTLPVTVTCQ
jgi:hypothetical protein